MSMEEFAGSILSKLKEIASAETVIGQSIESNGATIIPVSRVSVGFGLAGNKGKSDLAGSGGGASIDPVAFLVLQGDEIKLLPIKKNDSAIAKVVELLPDVIASFKKEPPKQD